MPPASSLQPPRPPARDGHQGPIALTGAISGLRSRSLRPGPVELADVGIPAGESGLVLVCDGLLIAEVQLQGTPAIELLGPGDLLRVGGDDGDLLGAQWRLTALDETRVASLDGHLQTIIQRSPALAERLVHSVGDRARRQLLHRTACQMPRVEDRILAVLWLLAERWGSLTPRGVELPFALPHARIGRLVGAARPTVTMAIGVLADAGHLVQPERQRFALHPSSRHLLAGRSAQPEARG